jgi:hypothetical protein
MTHPQSLKNLISLAQGFRELIELRAEVAKAEAVARQSRRSRALTRTDDRGKRILLKRRGRHHVGLKHQR